MKVRTTLPLLFIAILAACSESGSIENGASPLSAIRFDRVSLESASFEPGDRLAFQYAAEKSEVAVIATREFRFVPKTSGKLWIGALAPMVNGTCNSFWETRLALSRAGKVLGDPRTQILPVIAGQDYVLALEAQFNGKCDSNPTITLDFAPEFLPASFDARFTALSGSGKVTFLKNFEKVFIQDGNELPEQAIDKNRFHCALLRRTRETSGTIRIDSVTIMFENDLESWGGWKEFNLSIYAYEPEANKALDIDCAMKTQTLEIPKLDLMLSNLRDYLRFDLEVVAPGSDDTYFQLAQLSGLGVRVHQSFRTDHLNPLAFQDGKPIVRGWGGGNIDPSRSFVDVDNYESRYVTEAPQGAEYSAVKYYTYLRRSGNAEYPSRGHTHIHIKDVANRLRPLKLWAIMGPSSKGEMTFQELQSHFGRYATFTK